MTEDRLLVFQAKAQLENIEKQKMDAVINGYQAILNLEEERRRTADTQQLLLGTHRLHARQIEQFNLEIIKLQELIAERQQKEEPPLPLPEMVAAKPPVPVELKKKEGKL